MANPKIPNWFISMAIDFVNTVEETGTSSDASITALDKMLHGAKRLDADNDGDFTQADVDAERGES